MRILIISAYFPPYNAIGALRLGKLAKFLMGRGHDVRVVCADERTLPKDQLLEIPSGHVRVVTDWLDVNALPAQLLRPNLRAYQKGTRDLGATVKVGERLYRAMMNVPDNHIGWYGPAKAAAEDILRTWRADIIYASAVPFTGLMVAATLSRRHGIPWVAELRDLWTDNHYYGFPRWRRSLDSMIERRTLRSASFLVTVSEPLAETLHRKYAKPTLVVMNGFDPEDLPAPPSAPSDDRLHIIYTGMIYPGRRDPSALFAALRALGDEARRVRVSFYGRLLPGTQALIDQYDLGDVVEICGPVSYTEALRLQAAADVLLLLLWDNPEERGVFTGKLFEYLAARRPILSLGLEDGVAAELIRERNAGFVSNDPAQITSQLRNWIAMKRDHGVVPSLPADASRGLSREQQFAVLLPHLERVARQGGGPPREIWVVTRKLDVGGTERHLLQILPRLDRSRFAVSLLTLRGGRAPGRPVPISRGAGAYAAAPASGLGRASVVGQCACRC